MILKHDDNSSGAATATSEGVLRIRRMLPEEAEAAARCFLAAAGGDPASLPELKTFFRALNELGDGLVWVAIDEQERFVGAAGALVESHYGRRLLLRRLGAQRSAAALRELLAATGGPVNGPTGEIVCVAVQPSARRRGIGRALLQQVCEELTGRGVTVCRLTANRNSAAGPFFAAAGFTTLAGGAAERSLRLPTAAPTLDPFSDDPREIERAWYIPPTPRPRAGWLLYSESFVLESLQGCLNDPARVRRTPGWLFLARAALGLLAITQALVMLLSYIPGLNLLVYLAAFALPRSPVGFLVRGAYWKTRLARLGVDTLIDQGVEFTRPSRIEIGSRTHVDRLVVMAVASRGGSIRIGDFTTIGAGSTLAGRGGIWVGDFVGLSPRVSIYSVTNQAHDLRRQGELVTMSHTADVRRQAPFEAPVRIEDHAVVGFATLILPGVTIGRGAIVHGFAEVTRSIPPFGIAIGHGKAVRRGWRRPGVIDPRHPGRGPAGAESR